MSTHNAVRSVRKTSVWMVTVIAVTIVFQPGLVSGMGNNYLIHGNLAAFPPVNGVKWGMPIGRCVLMGVGFTGHGVEAVSYRPNGLECRFYNQVIDTNFNNDWCSQWVVPNSPDECLDLGSGTPILLDLDRNWFQLSSGPADFDLDADGWPEAITWVASGTRDAFLYLDRNGNGLVDDGSELFGDSTLLSSGHKAKHGYEALAEFDLIENGGNADGVLDSADAVFEDLGAWIDSDANGIHEPHESKSLAEAGVLSLDLDYRYSRRSDRHGNRFIIIGRGTIEVNGRSRRMWATDVVFQFADS